MDAFREVSREAFLSEDMQEFAYDDAPMPISEGQTISQPFIVARMIDAAGIGPGDRVLEGGAGSGYAAAVISRIGKEVTAIERHEVLATKASRRIKKLGYENCSIIAGDGKKGCADRAPFDAILVAARTTTVPEALKRQLKTGGRLVIPVGDERLQQLRLVERTGAQESPRTSPPFASFLFSTEWFKRMDLTQVSAQANELGLPAGGEKQYDGQTPQAQTGQS
ncbi:MAG: protein-L-isoaspartate(D-aspartate) O-methyltransferase [Sphingomonadaceae bacterium]